MLFTKYQQVGAKKVLVSSKVIYLFAIYTLLLIKKVECMKDSNKDQALCLLMQKNFNTIYKNTTLTFRLQLLTFPFFKEDQNL